MKVTFIILIFSKLSSVRCSADCMEGHLENCKTGDLLDSSYDPFTDSAKGTKFLEHINYDLSEITIPENFDSRTAFPHCGKVISRIKAQGMCNICWSYCSTMSMADRTCIASNGTEPDFSIVHINNCCEKCNERNIPPCVHGGFVSYAFEYAVEFGMVYEECQPYDTDKLNLTIPSCDNKCVAPYKDIQDYRHKGTKVITTEHFPDHKLIQAEIMTHGPLCGHIENMTDDFIKYWKRPPGEIFVPKKPITTPEKKSGHAIRIIGWGTQDGIEYWLIANSWGTHWGDQGIFKLPRSKQDNYFNVNEQFWGVRTGPIKLAQPKIDTIENDTDTKSSIKESSATVDFSPVKFLIVATIIFFFWCYFLE